nr:hypothetical protein [Tanacetum cinerariifolium]
EVQLHAKVDGKKIIVTESSVRRDLRLADKEDEAVHKELGDSLVRADTTASSLEAEQDNGNINKTQSKATPNKSTRVESSRDEASLGKDASKQERRIDAIDQDKDITLVNVQDDAKMFDVNDLGDEEVKRIVIHEQKEPGKSTKTAATISKQQSQDKGKGIMIEEPVKPKKKDQIRLDEEVALKLQAEFNEEERLTREKERERAKK